MAARRRLERGNFAVFAGCGAPSELAKATDRPRLLLNPTRDPTSAPKYQWPAFHGCQVKHREQGHRLDFSTFSDVQDNAKLVINCFYFKSKYTHLIDKELRLTTYPPKL